MADKIAWDDNTPPPPGIPTVSHWSLVIITGKTLLIAGGMIRYRGRRRPAGA